MKVVALLLVPFLLQCVADGFPIQFAWKLRGGESQQIGQLAIGLKGLPNETKDRTGATWVSSGSGIFGIEHSGKGIQHSGEGIQHSGEGIEDFIGNGIGRPGEGIQHSGEGIKHSGNGIGHSDEGIQHLGEGIQHSGEGKEGLGNGLGHSAEGSAMI